MPFDSSTFAAPLVETDEVLRCLIAVRDFHSNPENWCGAGMYGQGGARCIAAALAHVPGPFEGAIRAADYLKQFLPPEALEIGGRDGLVYFNERMGTTHAQLMVFYDRAIAARRASLS